MSWFKIQFTSKATFAVTLLSCISPPHGKIVNYPDDHARREMAQVKLLLFLILTIYSGTTRAQSAFTQDSANPAIAQALSIYAEATGNQAGFYNGIQYRRYSSFIHIGHPFFIADSLIEGTLDYDGVKYSNVKLQYDEVNDELITNDVQGQNLVQLYKGKVSAFSIGPHMFINNFQGDPGAGYYRVLYSGRSTILVKEKKVIQVKHGETNAETVRSVDVSTDYYLKTAKGFEKFNRLKSFLQLFRNKRKTVAGFIRGKNLKYRQDKENLFYQAATFYDQLTH